MSPRESPKKATDPETFEAALERLEKLVADLEAGDVPLEESLKAFEESQKLIAYCEEKLQAAEKALTQLAKDARTTLGDASDPVQP
jgi:exodeoxyribonuclease VII small subunit